MDNGGGAPNPEWDLILSAASKNQYDTIRRLITERGVPASHANAVGQSALHIASLWGHYEAVRTLVELGANVRAKNAMTGASPLHMLAQARKGSAKVADRLQIVDCLVKAGAAKDQMDDRGNIPADCPTLQEEEFKELLQVLQPSLPSIVEILDNTDVNALRDCLEQDSSAGSMVYMGKTPVTRVVESILEEIMDEENEATEEDLLVASEMIEDNLKCLKLLVEYGATTELVAATGNGLVESPIYQLLTALLEVSPKNQQHDKGESSDNNKNNNNKKYDDMLKSAIGYLMDGGAVLDEKTTASLLHQAARRNHVPFAKYCIETLRIDPNIKGRQGMTALQFAARSGQMEMLDFLLGLASIDANITDDQGQTPLYAARVNNRTEAVALLEKHAAKEE